MTIESCLAFCTPAGYVYAGVEFARECYCDNVIESPGAPISSSTCNMPCTGNSNEICGGAGGINIFQKFQTAGTFQYKGCYQDGVNGAPRSLRTQLSVSGGVTAESCTTACKAAGFTLAGLEFGQECWCDSYMPLAVLTPDTDCNKVCNADTTELCGAGNRLAVYVDSSAPPLNTQTCLNSAQLQATTFNFDLVAVFVPASQGAAVSPPVLLGNQEQAAHSGVATTSILTVSLLRYWFTYAKRLI
ncbi:hypothetical protein GALMADRAFT_75173 [Galerina marginata CBS 339.88]|uniref:WSC domain-containing protein n=1 Tax=Galerina marginata (strain CBS 339.88) TaxID=685588 RepID=A0A067SJS7_GALM3|nr:hypothetical protein GALMADRAFT_75173 [Galerina marginata CBS 339.88]